ncbi:uncharacterized protein MEPE_02732 [Melanopsichium pennsylvanicum]|uniref:GDT1 family protein n=1 Tax=Melanopsichium pennsylvanicum TaxID=63383 RepID=A0AAJ4XJS7_9BASI|nr:uncharacterized protein MEPE_02732 [Melanopsichium pennsylvanicum]
MEVVANAATNAGAATNTAQTIDLSMLMGGTESASIPSNFAGYSAALALTEAWNNDPRALYSSFMMIIVSEIGDKTFLIAAILAMRSSRLIVFCGAFASLAVMSVLSALLGVMFPQLLPKSLTNLLAAALFFVFGIKMVKDGLDMKGDEIMEEWEEAEREINEEEEGGGGGGSHELDNMEQGIGDVAPSQILPRHVNGMNHTISPPHSKGTATAGGGGGGGGINRLKEGTKNLCGLCFSPIFAQAFILTFLGEWGDRSQIATIALAAAHNVTLVCIGTIVGHACCTSIAVICGAALAKRISVKHVTLGGACLFLVFGVIYAWEAYIEPGLDMANVVQVAKGSVGVSE